MKTIIIDGSVFNDMESFYDEVKRKFCPDMNGFGRNLMALNDVLWGGFGVFDYGESIKVTWKNSEKSRQELNREEETKQQQRLERLEKTRQRIQAEHPDKLGSINKAIGQAKDALASSSDAKSGYDQLVENALHGAPVNRRIFDVLVDIIREHSDHIELVLD